MGFKEEKQDMKISNYMNNANLIVEKNVVLYRQFNKQGFCKGDIFNDYEQGCFRKNKQDKSQQGEE